MGLFAGEGSPFVVVHAFDSAFALFHGFSVAIGGVSTVDDLDRPFVCEFVVDCSIVLVYENKNDGEDILVDLLSIAFVLILPAFEAFVDFVLQNAATTIFFSYLQSDGSFEYLHGRRDIL